MSVNQNNATLGQKGYVGVTWPTFGILGPPNISRTVEAKNYKFGTKMDNSYFAVVADTLRCKHPAYKWIKNKYKCKTTKFIKKTVIGYVVSYTSKTIYVC